MNQVSREEAQETVNLWYSDRQEVLRWQELRKKQAHSIHCVYTLLGRARHFPSLKNASSAHRNHIERAAINTPVQVTFALHDFLHVIFLTYNFAPEQINVTLIISSFTLMNGETL